MSERFFNALKTKMSKAPAAGAKGKAPLNGRVGTGDVNPVPGSDVEVCNAWA